MDGSCFSAQYSGRLPDKAKVIKTLRLPYVPLVLTASASWRLADNKLDYSLTCTDAILGGRVAVDPRTRKVEYSKRFRLLPFDLATVVTAVEWTIGSPVTKPCLKIGFNAMNEGTSIATSTINGRSAISCSCSKACFFTGRIGAEVCASVAVSVPQYLNLAFDRRDRRRSMSEFLEGSALHVDVQEVNVLFRL